MKLFSLGRTVLAVLTKFAPAVAIEKCKDGYWFRCASMFWYGELTSPGGPSVGAGGQEFSWHGLRIGWSSSDRGIIQPMIKSVCSIIRRRIHIGSGLFDGWSASDLDHSTDDPHRIAGSFDGWSTSDLDHSTDDPHRIWIIRRMIHMWPTDLWVQ